MMAGSKRRQEDVEDTTLIEDFSKESQGAFHIFPNEILELILKYTDQKILMIKESIQIHGKDGCNSD